MVENSLSFWFALARVNIAAEGSHLAVSPPTYNGASSDPYARKTARTGR
jgi:hypothetical protein